MSNRHRDVLRPPIAPRADRTDPRVEPDQGTRRDLQMACLARIALVQRRVVVEPEERPVILAAPKPRPDFARPPRRPAATSDERGMWCFRPGDASVEVVDLLDDD